MKSLHLPCLRGNIGKWVYFSSIMKISDVINDKRIITVAESKELYTKNINKILQRDVDKSRIAKIKEYLLKSDERFFNSLIVAIHKGDPKWADVDLEQQYRIDNDLLDEKDVEFIQNKIGILTLNGTEEIFVLDGQHRLLGLRKAFDENAQIGSDELSVVFIVHKDNLKERTRRLFTVLNRYAVSIKPAEKVILEEDDAAAILTRRLVQEHKIFILDEAVSSAKQFNLPSTDLRNFTTLVCIYEINKILINYKELYRTKVIIRPAAAVLNNLYLKITQYWDFFFATFPDVTKFIKDEEVDVEFLRNKETGGSLLLRPEGQLLFAAVYREFETAKNLSEFKKRVSKIDFNLNGDNWKYVFWTGSKMEGKLKKLKKSIFMYLLGRTQNESYINKELARIYKEYNSEYKKKIKPVS